jgi:D-sedoheptulose 7-phosphate isomerase
MEKFARQAFQDNLALINTFLENEKNFIHLVNIADDLAQCFMRGGKVLICGNGGSACDSMHFAEELTGRFRKNRKALPAIALTDPGHLTCVANDMGYDQVFARGVEAYGRSGDFLIALSTSGNSINVIRAVEQAHVQQMDTICLLGKEGGKLKGQATHEIIIPGIHADRIQEVHMLILHVVIELLERMLFPDIYS